MTERDQSWKVNWRLVSSTSLHWFISCPVNVNRSPHWMSSLSPLFHALAKRLPWRNVRKSTWTSHCDRPHGIRGKSKTAVVTKQFITAPSICDCLNVSQMSPSSVYCVLTQTALHSSPAIRPAARGWPVPGTASLGPRECWWMLSVKCSWQTRPDRPVVSGLYSLPQSHGMSLMSWSKRLQDFPLSYLGFFHGKLLWTGQSFVMEKRNLFFYCFRFISICLYTSSQKSLTSELD